jgi:hypothetical protein
LGTRLIGSDATGNKARRLERVRECHRVRAVAVIDSRDFVRDGRWNVNGYVIAASREGRRIGGYRGLERPGQEVGGRDRVAAVCEFVVERRAEVTLRRRPA